MSSHSEKLRVLMVDSESTWRGGEAQLRLLMSGLGEAGVSVELAAPPDSEIYRRTRHLNVPFHAVPARGSVDVASAFRLRRVLTRGQFDVIHSHASHAHGVAFLACVGMRAKPLRVVSRRVDFPVSTNRFSALKYHRGADLYLAISSGVKKALEEGGVPRGKIRLVPSGIDLDKFKTVVDNSYVKPEFRIAPDAPVVGNVAALAPHKSQADLILAAKIVTAKIPEAKFLIVGEGKLKKQLQSLIEEKGLEGSVRLTGFREDPLEIMSTFTCFVLSSRLEGLGTSVMDAQAMGIPVVATETGGVPDIVQHDETGLLVPPGDPEKLAEATIRLLEDAGLRQRLTANALAQSRGYDYHNMVYKTLDAYQEHAGRHRRRTKTKGSPN